MIHLDPAVRGAWCERMLGSGPVELLFSAGHLSDVTGLRLTDGREVVVKARLWQDRLIACAAVQRSLWEAGFPAPEVLAGPTRADELALHAEALVAGGVRQTDFRDAAPAAAALAWLIELAPITGRIGSLAPSPPWLGWDHDDDATWPPPDDIEGDLNASLTPWLDDIGARTRRLLRDFRDRGEAPTVVGHGDWWSDNIRWHGDRLHVVHDWDSVAAQPQAALVGLAAAIWASKGDGRYSSLAETEAFLTAYADARGIHWSAEEERVAWAAGLWSRAFDAKKAALAGESPEASLSPVEAAERLRRAGL